MTNPFAELWATSNFSFLRGGSHPEEMVLQAVKLGYRALSIVDRNTLAGVVRAHRAAKDTNLRFIVGAQIFVSMQNGELSCRYPLLIHPISRTGYGNLCNLLTVVKTKLLHETIPQDIFTHYQRDWAITVLPPEFSFNESIKERALFVALLPALLERVAEPHLLSIAISHGYQHHERIRNEFIRLLAERFMLPLLASNNPLYHVPERRIVQDTVTCIRIKKTIDAAGLALEQNTERYLKTLKQIYYLFRDTPQSINRALFIAEACQGFSLSQLRYEYPDQITPADNTPLAYLTELTWRGAAEHYPDGIPTKVRQLIIEELKLIHELHYEKYFLTCYDIVKFARSKDILCQGRGAAANSAVCFALGITSVDPARIDTLFARFISKERAEPPDIDIDFEHERREEVIQYIYQKYGREHAAIACEVVTYRHRSAVRDVGKALGLSLDIVDKLAKSVHRWNNCVVTAHDLQELGLNPDDKTIRNVIYVSQQLFSFPRHISQHVGGFIISQEPLCQMVPIMNATMPGRTIIEWDKDDIEELGMLKIDILALGMLSCIRHALALINRRRESETLPPLAMHSIPAEDSATYDMICEADTVGVFQIESRAQMSMLPRLRPRCFYDLVIEVAIVRPGPIQGNMVHPYLKRRNGLEKPYYPDTRVKEILGKTLGVPLFQEQAMRLAITLAQFSPGEAEQLRRAMAAWKHNKEVIARFSSRVIAGMTRNGYSSEFALHCMEQIKGFSEYGFPESHAASFALLVYVSAWIKRHYPAEFVAALLNSQPMGFYAPAQIIRDAENPPFVARESVSLLPVDVNFSRWDCTVTYVQLHKQVRLGLRFVRGLGAKEGAQIESLVKTAGPFRSLEELWASARIAQPELKKSTLILLARADALHGITQCDRHQTLWQIHALLEQPMLRELSAKSKEKPSLPHISKQQSMFKDYQQLGFSLRAHPVEFIRAYLNTRQAKTAAELRLLRTSRMKIRVSVAGIAIIRQRPGTAKGVVFLTLEDETGIVNIMIRPAVYERFRNCIISSSALLVTGFYERVASVVYIQAEHIEPLDTLIKGETSCAFPEKSYSY